MVKNQWIVPAVGIAVLGWAAGAVWWASGTDTQVTKNTAAIEQVVENEVEIAVIEVQQRAISEDVGEIKQDNKKILEILTTDWSIH
jgi:hypothetical protein|tara:strand:- start:452 stop:709 length:258 start_codon:yes stop_codon:yes gene_type:complete